MQNFAIYRSSAGSGKTFSLVREYLRIALSDTEDPPRKYKEILAITFTNKAAAEMKERILRYLEELSVLKDEDMPEIGMQLMKILNIDRLTLCSRAKDVLQAVLHNYSEFSVGTIDAFTHRIVRAFAYDLDLPVNFEVETEEKNLIREAVDVLINRIGEDEQLTRLMVEYSRTRSDDEKGWQPEDEIRKISAQLLREEGGAQAEKLRPLNIDDFLRIRGALLKYLKQFENEVIRLSEAAMFILERAHITVEMVVGGTTGIYSTIAKTIKDPKHVFEIRRKLESISGGKFYSSKTKKDEQQRVNGIVGEFIAQCTKLSEYAEAEKETYLWRRNIMENIFALSLLNEIEKIIRDFRDKDHIIHISAFNRMIAEVVFREPAPFIYERLGEKYRNYLIDEFQDTSVMQWQNLLPLIDNSLAGGHYTMIVGDGKQAIYRWRNGDVKQFAALPKIISGMENELVQQRAASLVRNHTIIPLDRNFRSCREIVELNNEIFSVCSSFLHPDHRSIYDGMHQVPDEKKTGGYIEIKLLQEDEDHVQHCMQQIGSLLQEGWQPSDIAVILRSNDEVSLIGNALIREGIPVLASESLLLKNSGAVSFVATFLRYLDNPNDHLASGYTANWLASEQKIRLNPRDALQRLRELHHDLFAFLDEQLPIPGRKELLSRTIYDRTELIISAFGLLNVPDIFLLFFLDEVLHYMNSRISLKSSFHEWWADRSEKASIIVPEGTNAVSVMTIHKAKGLEFPVVLLPFADWKMKPQMPEMWVENTDALIPELKTVLITPKAELKGTSLESLLNEESSLKFLDLINELYVAMTRPSIRLYMLIGSEKISKKGEMKGVADLLTAALLKLGHSIDESVFIRGTPSTVPKQKKQRMNTLEPEKVCGNDWQNRIMIRRSSKELWEEGSARVSGKLLHLLLSGISSADDVERVVDNAINDGSISIDERQEIKSLIESIISSPGLAFVFDKKTKLLRERELLTPEGKILRPDVIAETKDGVIVLDYKTGAKMGEHLTQVESYARVLEQMGHVEVKRKLFYTATGECVDW